MSVKGIYERNRANAQKSTGPRTEEGKRISRSNAQKHGLCSEIVFVEGDYGKNTLEDMREYIDTMLEKRYEELDPQTWEEVFLAKQILSYEYRLLRCPSLEAEQLRALREASAKLYASPGCFRDADEPNKDNAQAHLRVIGIYTFLSSVYRYEKNLFSMLRETRLLYETKQAKRAYDNWRYPPGQPMLRVKTPEELAADPSSPFTAVTLRDIDPGSPAAKQPDVLIIRERDLPNFKLTGADEAEDSPETPIQPSAANPLVAKGSSRDEGDTTPPTHTAQDSPNTPSQPRAANPFVAVGSSPDEIGPIPPTHTAEVSPDTPSQPSAANPFVAVGSSPDEIGPTPTTDAAAAPPAKPIEAHQTSESELQNDGEADVLKPGETGPRPSKLFLRNEPKQPEIAHFSQVSGEHSSATGHRPPASAAHDDNGKFDNPC